MKRAARFYGGPWNAETREVDTKAVRLTAVDEEPTFRIAHGANDPLPAPRTGSYRQSASNPARYDWQGWDR